MVPISCNLLVFSSLISIGCRTCTWKCWRQSTLPSGARISDAFMAEDTPGPQSQKRFTSQLISSAWAHSCNCLMLVKYFSSMIMIQTWQCTQSVWKVYGIKFFNQIIVVSCLNLLLANLDEFYKCSVSAVALRSSPLSTWLANMSKRQRPGKPMQIFQLID